MDWSKSKSIFIVVFLILNIFLYTQYVDVYTQSQKVEVLSKKTMYMLIPLLILIFFYSFPLFFSITSPPNR